MFMNGFILTKRKLATGIMRKCLPYEMSAMYLYINKKLKYYGNSFYSSFKIEINCSNSVSLDATLKHGRVV